MVAILPPAFAAALIIWLAYRVATRNKPKTKMPPQKQPAEISQSGIIDARTLRRYVPRGTLLSDFIIPCPDCGWNEAMSRAWILANDEFICPRCNSKTHLNKVTEESGGPGAIGDGYDFLKNRKPKPK